MNHRNLIRNESLTLNVKSTNDDKRLGSFIQAPFSILSINFSPSALRISSLLQFLNASMVFRFFRIPWEGKKLFDELKSLEMIIYVNLRIV